MRKLIIGISGKAGSGKDTLAELMMDHVKTYGGSIDCIRVSFAAPLKEMATKYFPFCDVVTKDPVSRQTLQGLGTLMRDNVSENYWVDKALKQISEDQFDVNTRIYLITDLRYPNEANTLRAVESSVSNIETHLIRIVGRKANMGEQENHPSETSLDDYEGFDYVINNNGTLDILGHSAGLLVEYTTGRELML